MIEEYFDKFKGEAAFVLGAGPSLRKLTPDLISRMPVTIAMNSAILKVPDPHFYISTDPHVTLCKSWETVINSTCIIVQSGASFRYYEKFTGINPIAKISKSRILKFYRDKENGLDMIMKKTGLHIHGSSSAFSAVHFAYLLGCSPIILIGCDCCCEDGKKHFFDFPGQPQESHKSEYRKFVSVPHPWRGDTSKHLDSHLKGWRKLRQQNPNVNIINASGGLIDVFPMMSIDEVLERYCKK